MIAQLFTVVVLFTVVIVFGAGLLFLTSLVGPKVKQSARKLMPYECGVFGEDPDSSQIPVKFYLTAILFILFDIEVIYMYPWALVYVEYLKESAGAFIYMEMIVFMAILVWGLFYIWRGKALQWE